MCQIVNMYYPVNNDEGLVDAIATDEVPAISLV